MKRGEIWIVDFGSPTGPEQAGERPAILIQDYDFLAALTTVVVIPLTTNLKRMGLPTTVLIDAGEGGLERDSVALCHQVQARGQARLKQRIGELSAEVLAQVESCLLDTLGL